MHKYIIIASVLLPLIGVLQMENGAYGNSVGKFGYPNGATLAYAAYAVVLLGAYFLVYCRAEKTTVPVNVGEPWRFRIFSTSATLLVLLPALAAMLFVFGGWQVWAGQIAKGQFRAHLGPLGALAYMLINAFVPMCIAYAAALYRQSFFNWLNMFVLGILFVLTLLIGSTWGFKSTGITMLLPALLILFWNASVLRIAAIVSVLALVVISFFLLFDSGTTEAEIGMGFLWTRLTTLQGDVAWELWNQYCNGTPFPSYAQTLWALAGGKMLSITTGVTRDMLDAWANFHFDILLIQQIGLPISVVEEGHSIVGTPFADGLMMGGLTGTMMLATFSGLLSGFICRMLEWSLKAQHSYLCAILATYFGMHVITFLRNGVAIQLFHVSNLVGLGFALALCIVVDNVATFVCQRWIPGLRTGEGQAL